MNKSLDFANLKLKISDLSKCQGSGLPYTLYCSNCEEVHCQMAKGKPGHQTFDLPLEQTLPFECLSPEALNFVSQRDHKIEAWFRNPKVCKDLLDNEPGPNTSDLQTWQEV